VLGAPLENPVFLRNITPGHAVVLTQAPLPRRAAVAISVKEQTASGLPALAVHGTVRRSRPADKESLWYRTYVKLDPERAERRRRLEGFLDAIHPHLEVTAWR
jgi:hypothetical protein